MSDASDERLSQLRARLGGIAYGGDYNPEQWPREIWHDDARLMQAAGVNLVSVGVFSWSALEPAEGVFVFEWLDEVIDVLWAHDIAVNLATPNASPPPWLVEDHPEVRLRRFDGTRVGVGSRAHYCSSSPVYRDRSLRIARLLAARYGTHPALAMWHLGNEYYAKCYCELCDERFRGWLHARYGALDALNDAWGTMFWSQRYSAWEQVHVPGPVEGKVTTSRELDFARFSSDRQLELMTAERDVMRELTPGIPVTTNFMQYVDPNDYRAWAAEEDVVSLDAYPDPADPESLMKAALQYDLMRSLRGGRPWLLLEQSANAVSQWRTNLVKQPGRMRLGSYQAVARGADAVMFFQWRASRQGNEKFHSAMLPHGGTATRSWQAVRDLGSELPRVAAVTGARTDARVAVAFDWPNWWAVEGAAHPSNAFSYARAAVDHYRPLWHANVAVDVVDLADDLSAYAMVVVPNQYLITETQRASLTRFVEAGGVAVVSFFSGIVDECDRVIENGYPGGLRALIGAHVREFSPLADGATVHVDGVAGSELDVDFTAGADFWQDDIVLEGARALAVYRDGYLAGEPAITLHENGAGAVLYVGTRLAPDAQQAVTDAALRRAGIAPRTLAPGVEIAERRNDRGDFLFLLNHSDDVRTVTLDRAGTDLLTDRTLDVGDTLSLEPAGVAVVHTTVAASVD